MNLNPDLQYIMEDLPKLKQLIGIISSVLPDRHFIVDEDGYIITRFGNESGEGFFQTTDPSGKRVSEICKPSLAKRLMDSIALALEEKVTITIDYCMDLEGVRLYDADSSGPTGAQWFELKLVPLDKSIFDRPVAVCSNRNITERKLLELELKVLATTDPLTKLFNRRHMVSELENSFSRCKRYETPTTVLMLDIDFFKKINDTYGHDAGDKVLVEFSLLLQTHHRDTDIVGRIGGEEFLILMPELPINQGVPMADRLLDGIRNIKVAFEDQILTFSASAGISEIKSTDTDFNLVLKRADAALYQSKDNGRDQVNQK